MLPRVSVIIEGDNEKHCPLDESSPTPIAICLGLEGLLEQDFPLADVELILVGAPSQTSRWAARARTGAFAAIHEVPAAGADYFDMKITGRSFARAPYLAIVDSDVRPGRQWLSSLVDTLDSGHDIAAGLTRLQWHGSKGTIAGPGSALMLSFGAIAWGAILGPQDRSLGFHANNVGLRSAMLDNCEPPRGMLRACAAHDLFFQWRRAGYRSHFNLNQCVVHAFSFDWWSHMHQRSGCEAMLLRRMFKQWPHRWVTRLGWFEPILTSLWRMAIDTPQYWRYTRVSGVPFAKRVCVWPLFLLISFATHSIEALGAYRGLIRGDLQKEFAAHAA